MASGEIVRIGQALASAQIRARESEKRATQAEGLLRSVVAAVGDGSDPMLSSLSMEDWDLLQSFSAGMGRSPSFADSISSQSSVGREREEKASPTHGDYGEVLQGSEIRATHSAHFAESTPSANLGVDESIPAWFPETASCASDAEPKCKSPDILSESKDAATAKPSTSTSKDHVRLHEQSLSLGGDVALQHESSRAQKEVATQRTESKRGKSSNWQYSFLGLSSWGNVVQLLVGVLVGAIMGSIIEKRLKNRRMLRIKAETTQLVEQVRRLQLTNEIHQIYGSALRPCNSAVVSTLTPDNEKISFNGAMSIMSFWSGLASSSAEIS